ncbi:MAG: hypothetical protein UT02_C0066G0008 [Parcubacteria group bacterium GW2011_GWC2_38_7]|nr:MAG: hypothetical protein UT02_C0066G0008 [Parcubacteria group bacterium GW2011_GWC2_38_7]
MINKSNNFAYIDGANLDQALRNSLGWKLDYKRFRIWLLEKYGVQKAFIFIGFIPRYQYLYNYLECSGFILVYKEVVFNRQGIAKGNCDAELVLQSVIDFFEQRFEKAIIVSSDGDYACLANYLLSKSKLEVIISPAIQRRCSILLRRVTRKIVYLDDKKQILSA